MKKILKKPNKKVSRGMIIDRLENVSKTLFKKHYSLITDLIGNSSGVYALYDGNELYYVGKSVDLKRRVRHHLRDRHGASWTHFSLYLIRKVDYVDEIESLLVSIVNPRGNRTVPKGRTKNMLEKKLKGMVKQKQGQEFEEMFGGRRTRKKSTTRQISLMKRQLQGIVSRRTVLYRTYKEKEYKAILTPEGIIIRGNRFFNSPTAAAKTIIDRPTKTVNGWTFWYLKDSKGDWVRLSEYKG